MKTRSIITGVALGAFALSAQAQNYTTIHDNIQFYRPNDKDGINIFETYKQPAPPFDGMVVKLGGHFTQQFQALNHTTDAVLPEGGAPLIEIGNGFNLATANLNIDTQLTDGVRLNLVTYLSSRHHAETWVKAGYVQMDRSPIESEWLDSIMENVSIRIGHMEVNYGDMHFRRSDNAASIYNPFVGNLIMDAFATEIGAEVYGYQGDFFAMVGMTEGEIQGGVTRPDDRSPSYYGKVGFDRQVNEDLRVRLTGSLYTTDSSINNTLYSGDRAGSRYYLVLENPGARPAGNFTSGRFNPGFRDEITAMVINPFVKWGGLEFFGNIEQAKGRAANESSKRTWNQYAGEVVYRFLADERAYVGARYNRVEGDLPGQSRDASIDRVQIGGGWFINDFMLLKGEYVKQDYNDFLGTSDPRNGGKFDGFVVEAAVGF